MPRRTTPPPVDYMARTRELPVNLLFLMPWLFVYELCLLGTRCPVENAAGAWVRTVFTGLGRDGLLIVTLLICVLLWVVLWVRARDARHDHGVYGGMLLEGLVYGALLGMVAKVLAGSLPLGRMVPLVAGPDVECLRGGLQRLGLAIGAGIFEELVFRAMLLLGLYYLLRHALGTDRITAGLVSVLAAAWVFSSYHHWGVGGEPYHAAVFSFRFWAGATLGAIFLVRGLGIAAFAHGFYDALVMLG